MRYSYTIIQAALIIPGLVAFGMFTTKHPSVPIAIAVTCGFLLGVGVISTIQTFRAERAIALRQHTETILRQLNRLDKEP